MFSQECSREVQDIFPRDQSINVKQNLLRMQLPVSSLLLFFLPLFNQSVNQVNLNKFLFSMTACSGAEGQICTLSAQGFELATFQRSNHQATLPPGQQSLWHEALEFLGTGMMVVSLRDVGMTDWDKERLKMTVYMPPRCSELALRKRPGIPSGPAALRLLTWLKTLLRSD